MPYQSEIDAEVQQFLSENYDSIIQQFLYQHCATIEHTEHTLLEHLVNTARLLKMWGCAEAVCRAGLFHSIYGTEVFTETPVSLAYREEVRSVIGAEAERLAYLFGAMERQTLYNNLDRNGDYTLFDRWQQAEISLTSADYVNLFTMIVANWLEQMPRVEEHERFIRQEEFSRASRFLPAKAVEAFRLAYRLEG
jgi:hypothetical protein